MNKPRTDPIILLLTERNIDLERQLFECRRTIEEQRRDIENLRIALERPSVSIFTGEQLNTLSDFLAEEMWQRIMRHPIKKEPDAKN